jgi:hypothetical protein
MKRDLRSLLEKTLKEYGKITFDLTYVTKGCIVNIGIGDNKNEQCGSIYEELSSWLGYNEFIEYLMTKGVVHNFKGEICVENTEIVIYLMLKDLTYDFDADKTYIYLDKEFITEELNINISEIGMDEFDEEHFKVRFYKKKGMPIEELELNYFNNSWHQFNLDSKQNEILIEFIESEIEKSIPVYDVDFDCDVMWEVNCADWCLEFNHTSSPIKLKLNEIISEQNR